MPTITTLFSGGEGVGIGARGAGLKHLWGIEREDDIARVARDNGFNVIADDVTRTDPHQFERPDVLHASPPCPNFSNANQGGEETEDDIALADATVRFIEVLMPRIFTLENVYKYRKSQSWREIAGTLDRCGYWYDLAHVNAADFSVPQTRKRMIVRAMLRQMVPYLPPPEPWIGWYSAIEDLIPTLPESQFAPWQLERLPEEICTFIINPNRNSFNNNDYWKSTTDVTTFDRPMFSVTAQKHLTNFRAFLIGSQNAGQEWSNGLRDDDEPAMTISARQEPRAWLSQGRVVMMTPRALARFQTIPDWYELPESKTLACKIIGNAVPSLLYEKLIRQLITA